MNDVELERLAGDHLAPEARLLDPAEERQLAGVARVEQDGDAAQLRQGLDHQHSGQGGPTRKVPGEERLVAGEAPMPPRRDAGLDRRELAHEEERWSMRQDVGGVGKLHLRDVTQA